jgi:hypothetical protein
MTSWLSSALVTFFGLAAVNPAAAQSSAPIATQYGNSSAGISAGGLTPPGSADPTAGGYEPNQNAPGPPMQPSEGKDSGRGIEFVWLDGEAGFQYLNLNTFKANHLVDAQYVKSSQSGPVYGVAAGLRLIFLTLGAKFRLGDFSAWQWWTLDAEAGLHMPMGMIEPYFNFALGYASLGAFGASGGLNMQGAGVAIHGYNARVGFGLDFYLTRFVSMGALMTGDLLYMRRPKVDTAALAAVPAADQQAALQIYANDGSSIGSAATLTGVVGLHF